MAGPSTPTAARRRRVGGLAWAGCSVSAAMLAISGWQILSTPSASAAAVDGGRPQVIVPLTPAGPTAGTRLDAGGSAQAFSLRLPTGAACAGDSAGGGYRVQTFLVPSSVAPSTLTFDPQGPLPVGTGAAFRQPLFDVDGTPLAVAQTANADVPGGPGRILDLPGFVLGNGLFTSSDLPAGSYHVGVACTKGTATDPNQLDRYFSTTLEVVAAAGDPAGFTFRVPVNDAPGATTSTTSTTAASTTSTTAASTTSTTAASTTSTSVASTTSTTAAGTSSTTSTTVRSSSTTSTTVAGSSSSSTSTTAVGGAGSSTTSAVLGSSGSTLPRTGTSLRPLLLWSLGLLGSGSLLLGRRFALPPER